MKCDINLHTDQEFLSFFQIKSVDKTFCLKLAEVFNVRLNRKMYLKSHNMTALRLSLRSRQAFARIFGGYNARKWEIASSMLAYMEKMVAKFGECNISIEIQEEMVPFARRSNSEFLDMMDSRRQLSLGF